MKRPVEESVLVLNGSHAEIPLIMAARELGYRVVTTGSDALGLGHAHADKYIPADFSDVNAVLSIAEAEQVSGVISACNDFAAITASRVGHALGLPGHDTPKTTLALHHKDQFRWTMDSIGLPSIRSKRLNRSDVIAESIRSLQMPVIVKPVDLTGGKGMSICSRPEEVEAALSLAFSRSRADHVIVEEYLDGSNHGFTCFIASHQVVWWFADDEQYFQNPFLVAGTSAPSSVPQEVVQKLIKVIESLSHHLQLIDGLLHLQCILSGEELKIIEACRRCPGDLYPEFVRLSTGWDYATAIVRSELGLGIDIPEPIIHVRQTVRHCAMAEKNGRYREIETVKAVDGRIVDRLSLLEPGDEITDFSTQKAQILFLEFPSNSEKQAYLASRDDSIRVVVD